ncbi:MAG: RsbRD N-terminal domain-containing protein [Syntrophobacteraceae bacterium]|nr:RsbRD N-terminal domain-containing protein [Syntrophobacteraceae bacterium]
MDIEHHLRNHKEEISQKWFDLLTCTYPQESVRLLKKESNQFANPVGSTFRTAISQILDEFLGENRAEALAPLLDKVIRVRAVQSFAPSAALSFIFGLKTIAAGVLEEELAEGEVGIDDLRGFERKVEGLGLLAFDVYTGCRENLFEIKVAEIKRNTRRLLERAQIIIGDSDSE